jgi:L-ascorbate metabolism protein UlaG (beta-lactamase superfamily)
MDTRIKFFGLAAYEITNNHGQKILIDPCLDGNPASPVKTTDLEKVDLLLITHLAFDHLGDAAVIAKKFHCPVVCGGEVKQALGSRGVDKEQIRTLSWGVQLQVSGIRVRSIMSRHSSMGFDDSGNFLTGFPMGFIIYADPDARIYHSGDTAIYSDLRLVGELYRPNIGLISCCEVEKSFLEKHGIRDHYGSEMNGDEGAMAASWLGVDYALCNHYLSPENHADIDRFVSILNSRTSDDKLLVKPVVLSAGQTFFFPAGRVE